MADFLDVYHFRLMQSLPQGTVCNKAFFSKIHYKNICATFIYRNICVRYFWQNSLFWHQMQATMTYFWDVSHLRQRRGLVQRSVGNRAYSLKIHHKNIGATFIYMYIYIRYFRLNSLLWHQIQTALADFWAVSPFRQCPAHSVLSGQHGLFLKHLPYRYMCYFHIYAHIYKVFLAKRSFLTWNSGRNGRFLRCVSLSARAKPFPRHGGHQGLFLKNPLYKYMCYCHIYKFICEVFLAKLTFWTSNSDRLGRFLRCVSISENTQPFPRHSGQQGLFLKNTPYKYKSYFHIYARTYKKFLVEFTFLTSNSGRLGRFLRCI